MSRKYFGTDGVRGRFGEGAITPEFVLKLGWAVGRILGTESKSRVLIGKDTRISGYLLESALEAGLTAAGVNITLLGPMPTPSVAYLTRTLHAQAGIVISASHNPYTDNGIKFFSADGLKLPDQVESAIEAEMEKPLTTVDSANLGRAEKMDAEGRYIEFCKSTIPLKTRFNGMKIVVDCSNGAAYNIAPYVFDEMGADVIAIGNQPNGFNINDGVGSTHPEHLKAAVLEHGADLGIALDGDGDRLIMVDDQGNEVDGDEILYIIACSRMREGELKGAVVGTLMSNLGLEHALREHGVVFERTNVGDRYIMERLFKKGWVLGGEQSGHIICLDRTTTGDGIVSALQVLAEVHATGRSLRELSAGMSKYPQKLTNIHLGGTSAQEIMESDLVKRSVREAEVEMGSSGRVLLRPSGTEPLMRVMVEGSDGEQVEVLSSQIASTVEALVTG
ncbi:MAG: phosphoglucosamine mutase [Candidatus Thiodiazotropha weberae]|uniref:Phosphoglucosamine mutase n=1 Tax=Candidatus Thiodiazotropha endoloripes TaxID=1818881 RepID=A0A1E2UJ56_9GAMM|nr:phosphoglucosamine mutase [Candidatus Thiodiazotropha endoloripes]MCG7899598.1 phosphoglucosamine mutase [Candidatus Thiodiazotropha weberae]MCG7901863.1 phosphoglucosamine mutase [Candidatus Thiodiazotropha weberae]MCG7912270.1 phosphoglucosamine mutase [Candidatus Thiodiazotropha weberae]ODB83038.1 phosphoglucosamine mutase [Candidatus Thiodiazotropha endoloripes]ODB83405.1 phosphoglucosamine mutase [Candidatus Thiodiazotropha endoloripes]